MGDWWQDLWHGSREDWDACRPEVTAVWPDCRTHPKGVSYSLQYGADGWTPAICNWDSGYRHWFPGGIAPGAKMEYVAQLPPSGHRIDPKTLLPHQYVEKKNWVKCARYYIPPEYIGPDRWVKIETN